MVFHLIPVAVSSPVTMGVFLRIVVLLFVACVVISTGYTQHYTFDRSDTIPVIHVAQLENAWAGGLNATQVSTLHLDSDGKEDLFVFDRVGDKIYTFLNTGSAGNVSYKHAPEYESQFPDGLRRWVLLRDYNGDGKKDIFTYHSSGMQAWLNTSGGGALSFVKIKDVVLSLQGTLTFNLYVSSTDIPSIDDIDGDGDLDVVSFDQFGSYLEYHRNLSQETYGHSDSLLFELRNHCWGHFSESGSTNALVLLDTCDNSTLGTVELGSINNTLKAGGAHAGSTVLTIDLDADGVRDLLIGDVMFNNVVMLENGGAAPNMNSSMIAQDTAFPSYDQPVDIQIFPACFYEDIDNDGIRDLTVTSNSEILSEDNTSLHLYLNSGTDDAPIFNYQQNDFLQNNMIDLGSGAIPVFFDHNADGLMDLIVSNYGVLNKLSGDLEPTVWLYENQGTATSPEFHLITQKYMNLNTSGIDNNMVITFGDLDGDGDEDMMIGDATGMIHYFTNTAGAGNTANFVLTAPNYQDVSGSEIDVGLRAAPWLYDMDGDMDLDMIIGEQNGNINYYRNVGSPFSPSFDLVTDTLGGIRSHLSGSGINMSVPRLYQNSAGETQLFVGTGTGEIRHYDNIDGNISGDFDEVDALVTGESMGPETALAWGDINSDGENDLLVGNRRGGLICYIGTGTVSTEEIVPTNVVLYPNPAENEVYVEVNEQTGPIDYELIELSGRRVANGKIIANHKVSLESLAPGAYLLRLNLNSSTVITKKLIIR